MMRRRMRWRSRRIRKPRKPPSGKRRIWLIILLVSVFCVLQGFAYVEKK